MSLFQFSTPKNTKILFNQFHDDQIREHLSEDLLAIELPNGVFIDVGWYPARTKTGSYLVAVYQGEWENPLEPAYRTKDANDAARVVREMLDKYAKHETAIKRPKAV
jgi:hypothetical protein